jgi:AcrR family transcriptional regulator
MTAEARRHVILEAAREAFSETGDVNATTVKMIAAHAKISEGVIYHHFESKDELFFAAIVEPLERAIRSVVENVTDYDPSEFTPEDLQAMTTRFWASMIRSIEKIVPLFGLVLFGEPERARRFYRGTFSKAIDELAGTWQKIYDDFGVEYSGREVAMSTVGIALAFALDARYGRKRTDLEETALTLASFTHDGFWPPVE